MAKWLILNEINILEILEIRGHSLMKQASIYFIVILLLAAAAARNSKSEEVFFSPVARIADNGRRMEVFTSFGSLPKFRK